MMPSPSTTPMPRTLSTSSTSWQAWRKKSAAPRLTFIPLLIW
jgi:hypothetical protein